MILSVTFSLYQRRGYMKDNAMERSCIDCAVINCNKMDKRYPDFCLTVNVQDEVMAAAMEAYQDDINHKIAVASAEVEADYYCTKTRVEEIIEFAKKINAKK